MSDMENPRRDMVLEALKAYPKAATLTLAKQIYTKAPEAFKDVEHVRNWVRRYRGNMGKVNREREIRSGGEHIRDNAVTGDYNLHLPDPIDNWGDSEPYKLRATSALILSDVHVPFHEKRALEVAIEEGIKNDVQAVILNGDFCDFWSISRFLRDPRKRNFPEEIETVGLTLKAIREAFPLKQIIFKDGNHEERWFRYIYEKVPELVGMQALEIDSLLGLEALSIRRLDKRQHIEIQNLNVIHGHEFGRTMWNPVSAARGLYLKAKATAIIGHYHVTSSHSEKTMNDKIIGAWSMGCLCNLRPDYARYNNWNHGFAIVYVADDGHFRVDNRQIIKGRLI